MNPEQVQHAYELITNPILRLLVYFLSAAVVGLSATCVYLYRDVRKLEIELLAVNREIASAHTQLAAALEALKDQLDSLQRQVIDHLLSKKP